MRRNLEDIIKEINNLDNDLINKLTSNGIYQEWKNGKYQDETNDEEWNKEAEQQKKNAIDFITRKYKELDSRETSTNREYEIADFKVFEQYFSIVKDKEEKARIDNELSKETEEFFDSLSKVYDEEESREINISYGKNGNGFTSTRISIPVGWTKILGFSQDNRKAIVTLEQERIIIKKA